MPKSKIRVVVRKRPLNRKELEGEDKDILVQRSTHTLVVREERVKLDLSKYIEEHHFTFDEVFNESIQNEEFYQRTV